MLKLIAILAGLTVLVAACAADVGPDPASGPGISVSEAIAGDAGGPVLVNGYLFIDGAGRTTLAELVAESFPPQAAGATLEVKGLDPSEYEGLESTNGVQWSPGQVQVLGTVQDGVITVSGLASA